MGRSLTGSSISVIWHTPVGLDLVRFINLNSVTGCELVEGFGFVALPVLGRHLVVWRRYLNQGFSHPMYVSRISFLQYLRKSAERASASCGSAMFSCMASIILHSCITFQPTYTR